MKRALGCLAFMLVGAIIGLGWGLQKANAWLSGATIPWVAVPMPAGYVAKHFVLGEGPRVFVETEQGMLFVQPLSFEQESRWRETASVDSPTNPADPEASGHCGYEQYPFLSNQDIREPPGAVREQIDCSYMGHAELAGGFRYVILENGEIYRWAAYKHGLEGLAMLIIYCSKGGAIGALGGLSLFAIVFSLVTLLRESTEPKTA
jgi:hypothetical protein